MAAAQDTRRRRAKKNRHGTDARARPSRKTLAAALYKVVHNLALVYSTCVTVQHALKAQNADQDTEIGECLQTHVTAALFRQVTDLRELAQALHRSEEGL